MTREEILNEVKEILSQYKKEDAKVEKIEETTHLSNDLQIDSLDYVEILMALEEKFSIEPPKDDAPPFNTIGEVVDFIANQMK